MLNELPVGMNISKDFPSPVGNAVLETCCIQGLILEIQLSSFILMQAGGMLATPAV